MRWFLLILFLPTLAWADCAAWKLCPYVISPEDACSRWLSIARKSMPRWDEIEVEGNEANGGRALVCFHTQDPGDLSADGCTDVNRGQLQALIKKPAMPYCAYDEQGNSKRIEFFDGKAGRREWRRSFNQQAIRRSIKDPAIDTGVLNR